MLFRPPVTLHEILKTKDTQTLNDLSSSEQMAMKGLRVAHELLGSEGDPNAPQNRPKFEPTAQQPIAAEELRESAIANHALAPGEAAQQGLALAAAAVAAAAGGGEKVSRPRRTSKLPRHLAEGMDVDDGAELSSVAGKVRACACTLSFRIESCCVICEYVSMLIVEHVGVGRARGC